LAILGVDSELLSESQFNDGLVLKTPEEGEDAGKQSDREIDQRPHGSRRVRDHAEQNESESGIPLGVSTGDGCDG
jgi:hypothetical protein